jgi:hypothetical protein
MNPKPQDPTPQRYCADLIVAEIVEHELTRKAVVDALFDAAEASLDAAFRNGAYSSGCAIR